MLTIKHHTQKSSLSKCQQTHDIAHFQNKRFVQEFTSTCCNNHFCVWAITNVSTNVNDVLGSGDNFFSKRAIDGKI